MTTPVKGSINWKNFITVLSVAILVGTETVGIGLAFGWALGGYFEFSKQGVLISEIIFSCVGFFVLYVFFNKAKKIEPIRH